MTRLHSEEFYYNRKNKPSVFFYRVGLDLLGGVSAAHPLATDSEIPAEARAAEFCRKALALENRGDHLVFSGPSFAQAVASVDRKSTRLNSSHVRISYAVFCLKKKNQLH